MKKSILRSFVLIVTLFLFPAILHAFNADLTTWKSVYPSSTLGNSLSCNLCHGSSSKTLANATSYGRAVWGTSPISASAIRGAEGLDSDGDGSTNITEINANTNPSDPNSKPAPPPPPPVDNPPQAKITVAKTTFTVGETATFSGSTSSDDKGIAKYEWDLNGDNTIDASGVTASTTYAAAGSYKVTLKVTDTIGQTGSASVNITVNAAADTVPIAKITVAKTTFTVGETATFSGSTSTDDKGITKYEWDFTSNGSIDVTGVNASTSYPSAGTYRVTLKVTDTIGQTGSASVNITVNAAADTVPIAKITVAKTTFTVGETATFSGSTSTDDKGITKYEWDFTSNGSIDATGVNASTSYPSAGTYRVTLKVTDTIGQAGTATLNLTVSAIGTAPPPGKEKKPGDDRDDDSKKREEERKKKEDERKKKEEERKKK